MRDRCRVPAALLAAGLLFACSRSPAPTSGSGGAPALPSAPTVRQKTTRGDIALRNLTDRIGVLEKQAAQRAQPLAVREQLATALLQRAQFVGTFDDFTRVLELADAAVRDFPGDKAALLLRARAESAVHRFDDALTDLDAAAGLGADVDARRASIHLALGRDLEKARAFAQSRVDRAPTVEHLGLLANAEAAVGDFDAADEHYQAALDTLKDVSPFPVAQLSFQRGVMWAEQAHRPERALPFYAEAVRRLPGYVVANVHLAELEAATGRRDAAIARLQALVEQSGQPGHDPEPLGVLAELLLARDPRDPSAAGLIERARQGYDALLARHRSAFLDHGAEFFAGPGNDQARALELARENLALRQTPRAYALAIESALGAGDAGTGCGWMAEAAAVRGHSPQLGALLDRESGRCATR
jgi:tetratricopeptide (TPR) repeat protein